MLKSFGQVNSRILVVPRDQQTRLLLEGPGFNQYIVYIRQTVNIFPSITIVFLGLLYKSSGRGIKPLIKMSQL